MYNKTPRKTSGRDSRLSAGFELDTEHSEKVDMGIALADEFNADSESEAGITCANDLETREVGTTSANDLSEEVRKEVGIACASCCCTVDERYFPIF